MDTEKIKILMVDDHEENLLALSAVLTDPLYDLITVHSGREALRHLLTTHVAVILLDVQMPGMDGFETAKLIRERKQSEDTPIIFLTAYEKSSVQVFKGYSVGAVDYMFKPLVPEIIKAKVAVFADMYKKSQAIKRHAEILATMNDKLKVVIEERRKAEDEVRFLNVELEKLNLSLEQTVHNRTKDLESEIQEHQKTETALRESQNKYRNLVENINEVIFSIDPSGVITYISPVVERITGLTPDELIGRPFTTFLCKEDIPTMSEAFLQVLSGNLQICEYRIIKQNKSLWISISSSPILKEGNIVGIQGVITDITERKCAEEALRLDSAMMMNMAEGVFLIRASDSVILYTNPKFVEMFGYGQDELIGKHVSVVNSPNDESPEERAKKIAEALTINGVWNGDVYNIRKDGKTFWCYATVSTFEHTEYGKVWVSVHKDITERKQAEEALKESEEQFRITFNQAAVGVSIVSLNNQWLQVNKKLCSILGYSEAELLQMKFKDVSSPDDLESDSESVRRLLTGEINSLMLEKRYIHKNGSEIWVHLAISLVHDAFKTPKYFITITEDITERRKNEQELIIAKERAEQSDKLKDAFIANISHEIRTPLNVILGFTGIVEETFSDQITPREQIYFNSIENGAQRLMRTVDLILNVSRVQIGDYKLNISRFNLSNAIEKLVDQMRYEAEKKLVTLEYDNEYGFALVIADEYCITEAVSNLINNAIKFTQRGSITIRLYQNASYEPCLDISDTGIGISDEYLPHLFEPYSQEDFGYTRRYEGIGLGLALVKRYFDLHEIPISVRSKKNAGTTFTLNFRTRVISTDDTLPSPPPQMEEKSDDTGVKSVRQKRIKVLAVEDDEQTIGYYKVILRDRYDVFIVDNAEEAWDIIRSQSPDIIMMDISIQGKKNGLDLTREIRASKEFATLPIIAVTAHAFPRDRVNSIEAGCNEYIVKPMSRTKLYQTIEQLLSERE